MARTAAPAGTKKTAKPAAKPSKTAEKPVVKPAKKAAATTVTPVPAKPTRTVAHTLSVPVLDVSGKEKQTVKLPEELFGAKVNKPLLAQAVRVFLANQREGSASTKTRGEVTGSTKKIYRQKGTGRARHGGIRAPIFVGGGITFGPKPRAHTMSLPKNMRRAALASALTQQLKNGNIVIVDGFESLEPKTKLMAEVFKQIGTTKNVLFVVAKESQLVLRSVRNIDYVDSISTAQMHAYAALSHRKIVFMKPAISELTAGTETKKV